MVDTQVDFIETKKTFQLLKSGKVKRLCSVQKSNQVIMRLRKSEQMG